MLATSNKVQPVTLFTDLMYSKDNTGRAPVHSGAGSTMQSLPAPRVGTLGMFIIDTFEFLQEDSTPENPKDRGYGEQIGGAGSYAMVGARAWIEPDRLRMIVHRGMDWKLEWQGRLETYMNVSDRAADAAARGPWIFRTREAQRTTRAVNIYQGQHRGFEYLTPKLRIEPEDFVDSVEASLPEVVHFVCSPDRAEAISDKVDSLVATGHGCSLSLQSRQPLLVWEPIPDSATHENLRGCLKLFPRLHVFSPNHEEAANLLAVDPPGDDADARSIIEELAEVFVGLAQESQPHAHPIICIRSGKLGSYIRGYQVPGFWSQAYHTEAMKERVVDVTGGGNGWLGGFCAILANAYAKQNRESLRSDEALLKEAADCASISASYIIEQLGLPDIEVWSRENGTDAPVARLAKLRNRRA